MNAGILTSGHRSPPMPFGLLGRPSPFQAINPVAIGFAPNHIYGLQAWYDFADPSTLGPTSAGSGSVASNTPVRFVRDKSLLGRHLTQTGGAGISPTFLPSALNGLSALSFDGNDYLNGASSLMTAPFSLFVVARANVTGTSRVCGVGSTRSIGPFAASSTQWGYFQTPLSVVSFGVSATAASVLAITCTASLAAVLWGNGRQSIATTLSTMTPAGFSLGGDVANAGTLNGSVYEVISYSVTLTSSEVAEVNRYLGRKWGINVL